MKTKLFLLMAIVLFACSTAKAYDALIDGIYYNFNGDEAEVTYENTAYNSYTGSYTGDVVIPGSIVYNAKTYSVKSIGSHAFAYCYALTSVTIPNSVTSIGDQAFEDCRGLTSVTIPNSVTSIGNYAFAYCYGLTSVTIGNSVTSIGSRAFSETPWYNNLPDGMIYIGLIAYKYKGEMPSGTRITIKDGIVSIGDYAFEGCTGLTTVIIPNSVTSIGSGAFYDCDGLTSVTIPNSVTSIGNNAFYNCSSLTSVTIPNSVTSIGNNAFYNCSSLTSVTIPNSVTSIGDQAFSSCSGLEKVIVPDIAAWCGIAFDGYQANPLYYAEHLYSNETTEITNLIIPNSVTSIGSRAFCGCSGLTSVTIPNSVTSIGDDAFNDCRGLTSVTILNSVTSIGSRAFYYCRGLTSITIPKSVTSIGVLAFNGCSGLTSVTLNSNAIASKKYTRSSSLEYVFGQQVNTYVIGEDVTSIGDYAFSGCDGLTSVNIPNSVTSIGEGAFYNCGLTSVTIGNSVTDIGNNAFYDCDGLKKVIVPDIAAWCNITFEDYHSNPLNYAGHLYSDETTEITNLIIPNSVTSIGKGAFQGCSGLTSVNIGNSVKSIEYQAFAGCKELTDVYCLAENVPNTSNYAFGATILNATLHVPYGCKAAYEAASPWNEFGKIVEIPIPITIGETGFATFCSPHALDFSEVEDIRAYIVSGFNQETGTLVLTRVTEVPAGEGLYIAGMPGNHEIPQTKTSMFYANLLKGVTEPTIISPTDGNYTNYILSNGSYGVGFYTLSQTGTLDAGKAYLQLPTASVAGIKALKIEFDENDDPTGIAITSTSPAEENTIYNLAGQRVSKAHRGINIVNGKKVFIK